jgi:COP9 signalosome complex subunit 3
MFCSATSCNLTIFFTSLYVCVVLNVCRVLKDQVMQLNTPIRGIAPLRAAIRKIRTSPEQLTPVHADCLLLCLLAKQYKAGLSVLEDDIFEVDQPKDLFLYCYYGSGSIVLSGL